MNRFQKILKWTGIVAGAAIATLLIANALFGWRTGTRLGERLAALRQAGEPIRIELENFLTFLPVFRL